MSNFQLGLIIAGALVLVVVVAYNAWTERRNTPKRASPREGDKAQEPAVRQEPAFDGAGLAPAGAAQASATEPHFEGHAVDARDALDLPVPQPERRGGLDPLIDVIRQSTRSASRSTSTRKVRTARVRPGVGRPQG